jgi:hypothetical protein
MDEAALGRRIAAIERAKGRHAVVKMRLFARVLFLEARPSRARAQRCVRAWQLLTRALQGYEELAQDATAALLRLIEILGDAADEEEAAAE